MVLPIRQCFKCLTTVFLFTLCRSVHLNPSPGQPRPAVSLEAHFHLFPSSDQGHREGLPSVSPRGAPLSVHGLAERLPGSGCSRGLAPPRLARASPQPVSGLPAWPLKRPGSAQRQALQGRGRRGLSHLGPHVCTQRCVYEGLKSILSSLFCSYCGKSVFRLSTLQILTNVISFIFTVSLASCTAHYRHSINIQGDE